MDEPIRTDQLPERAQHYYARAPDGGILSVTETLAYDVDTQARIVLCRRSEPVERAAEHRVLQAKLALYTRRVHAIETRLEALDRV